MPKWKFSESYYRRSEEVLRAGLETTPVYRAWRELDSGRDRPLDERYAALPELTKQAMREFGPQGLAPFGRNVAEGLRCGEIELVQTSGTTAEKVTNIWNQAWWNASEAASWKLNAYTARLAGDPREAQLASAMSVGFRSAEDLPMHARLLGRFLFLNEKVSAQEWAEHHYARMVRELEEFQPAVLETNPSLLGRLAWWAMDQGVRLYAPPVILLTYEFPSEVHLRGIRQAYPGPLISSFGSTETGYVFMQCEHGTFHQNTDFCRVDFQPLQSIHGGPRLGRLLVTPLQNFWAVILRFDVGDLVRLDERPACPCGRAEGIRLTAIEGRTANATFTLAGRLVTTKQVDDALAQAADLRDYQLDQVERGRYVLKIVVVGDPQTAARNCRNALRALYGSAAEIIIEPCADIAPGPSGKYRRTCASFEFNSKGLFA